MSTMKRTDNSSPLFLLGVLGLIVIAMMSGPCSPKDTGNVSPGVSGDRQMSEDPAHKNALEDVHWNRDFHYPDEQSPFTDSTDRDRNEPGGKARPLTKKEQSAYDEILDAIFGDLFDDGPTDPNKGIHDKDKGDK